MMLTETFIHGGKLNKLLRYKLSVRLLISLCLLLYASTGQAFWCTGAKGVSHLELNSIGSCNVACHPDAEKHQRNAPKTDAETAFSDIGNDCFDIHALDSVISSSNKDCFKNKPGLWDFVLPDPIHSFSLNLRTGYRSNQFLAFQLPPPQALTALRTVVLLH